ncbi:tRNA threonylcarbamoyl adenosine modification protein YeaZ [Diaminobutyricimonas aerilata]|uniref:tRNA threonylcarbamoyl adenosine modification protein YeaZ n=1 Tax=Diaminobutyricimonas aerilata TaxID=1162967 RepID=A0A2M9CMQ4_9MICO|nr:tRNA (adenosine(37)-N6)-threonylcarbamoyltransferase complex dimerization subunit type 1 TsaB [Diaminobutyricimonas aerilata]PJJ73180.1 tRNA threonylcarbamoyl adenosine modification protein YeaZ [Diaminobutyricimonas aerilata]
MLLAIDTSSGTSVAVVDRDAGVLAEHTEADTRRHAEVVGLLIERSLADAGVTASDLSGVAVGMGPGPFTGLRVGIAAARTFAFGTGRPLVPVVSHDALAFAHADAVAIITDARRREVYWSEYDAPDELGLPRRIRGPEIARPDELETALPRLEHAPVSAGALGMLAERLYAAGRPFADDRALYLRSPDVTMSASNRGARRVS